MIIYDVFLSICLGLFIGGIILAIISTILAEISTQDYSSDGLDHVDHIDHIDHLEKDFDHLDHFDHINGMDDVHDIFPDDTTPAPFMLLLSTTLLFFGALGLFFSFILIEDIKYIMFILTPSITYIMTKSISMGWKKMAKSRYYSIISTKNLIGKEGEVVLDIDDRGGVIKIRSNTPLKFERVHVKPLQNEKYYKKGEMVYICDMKQGFGLVDKNPDLIRRLR